MLVIDDDPDARALYTAALEAAGYECFAAATWREGEERLRVGAAPDVIVMDRWLPDADGWNVVSHLKAEPTTSRIHVVALTADVDRESVLAALEAGCDAFLGKPCDAAVLVLEVGRALTGGRTTGTRLRRQKDRPR